MCPIMRNRNGGLTRVFENEVFVVGLLTKRRRLADDHRDGLTGRRGIKQHEEIANFSDLAHELLLDFSLFGLVVFESLPQIII